MAGIGLTGAIILWVIPAFVARSMGPAKNREGWAYGLFLGWIGVLILALLPVRGAAREGRCPWCKEPIHLSAVACPHCQRDVLPFDEKAAS